MVDAFAIEDLQPSPGVFDIQKLYWMNGAHIRALSPKDLYRTVHEFDSSTTDEEYRNVPARASLVKAFGESPAEYVTKALVLEQERVKLLTEFAEACEFFFTEDYPFEDEAAAKWRDKGHVPILFDTLIGKLKGRAALTVEECEALVGEAAEEIGLEKRAEAIHPLRLALTGRTKGPGLWDLMALLGPERISTRLGAHKSKF
jgi:glutamyl/glutaminyl-tRNA synthetase